MLSLSLSELVTLYFIVVLAPILAWWAWAGRRQRARWRREARWRIVCRACGQTYHDDSPADLPTCPYCGRANERCRDPLV